MAFYDARGENLFYVLSNIPEYQYPSTQFDLSVKFRGRKIRSGDESQ